MRPDKIILRKSQGDIRVWKDETEKANTNSQYFPPDGYRINLVSTHIDNKVYIYLIREAL